MSKFFKVLFAVVPTAVVFSAVAEARSGHHGGGGPTYQEGCPTRIIDTNQCLFA